ncbi:T9SS type A sorting domain-containing protein [Cryomorphaceae bacterium]|nr:T9SS type A sorting domain-containing protein [Cryomorphaceae bacterium]
MSTNRFARKKRQFKRLSEQIQCLRHDGRWDHMDSSVQNKIANKLKNLFREIYAFFTRSELKRAVLAAGFIFAWSSAAVGQQFAAPQQNPFGLSTAYGPVINLTLMDIDQDGDLDLFGSGYYGNPLLYVNNGTPNNPSFGPGQLFPFGLSGIYSTYTGVADIDGDGDVDILASSSYAQYPYVWLYHQNIGTAQNPSFSGSQVNPFGLSISGPGIYFGKFADLDNDGDLDLFGTAKHSGSVYYYQNNGNDTIPSFGVEQTDPFGLTPTSIWATVSVGDIDMDGDLDVMGNTFTGDFIFFLNNGSSGNPLFGLAQMNLFGLTSSGDFGVSSAIGDLDNDGDLDILSVGYEYSHYGSTGGRFSYYENVDIGMGVEEQEIEVSVFPNPTDGHLDLEFMEHQTGTAHVVDLLGKKLMSKRFEESDGIRLDLGQVATGQYFIQIETENGSSLQKITKQ